MLPRRAFDARSNQVRPEAIVALVATLSGGCGTVLIVNGGTGPHCEPNGETDQRVCLAGKPGATFVYWRTRRSEGYVGPAVSTRSAVRARALAAEHGADLEGTHSAESSRSLEHGGERVELTPGRRRETEPRLSSASEREWPESEGEALESRSEATQLRGGRSSAQTQSGAVNYGSSQSRALGGSSVVATLSLIVKKRYVGPRRLGINQRGSFEIEVTNETGVDVQEILLVDLLDPRLSVASHGGAEVERRSEGDVTTMVWRDRRGLRSGQSRTYSFAVELAEGGRWNRP